MFLGSFKHVFIWRKSFAANPYLWWKRFLDFDEEKILSENAVKILSVPTFSAAIDRNFSSEARIHTKRRNTLSNECVEKLLAIEFNSRKGINYEGLSY